MRTQKQAGKTLKKKMIDRGVRLTDLARNLDHDPAVISKALNHGVYPRVREKIRKALNA